MSDTPPAPAPAPSSNPLDAVIEFLQDLIDSVTPSGTQTVLSYVVDVVGVLGVLVGTFNKHWGIDLSSVPQTTLIIVSTVILLGINAYRLYTHQKVVTAKLNASLVAADAAVLKQQ